jgi:EPS-associated MarR family transcriptional regulator
MTDDAHYKLLKLLEANPQATQRELASEMGVSLGKVNYCLKALIEKGWVKMDNFSQNPQKLHYAYLLTPLGLKAKTTLATNFLKRKLEEYEALKAEIEQLQSEAAPATAGHK